MLTSASQLDRALLCPASSLLPRNRREPGAKAKRGTLIHACVAAELRGWEKPDTGRYRLKYDMAELRHLIGDRDLRCELAMAWSPSRGGRILGENIGRDYKVEPYEIVGTADIVGVHSSGSVLVVDIKTGQKVAGIEVNWQMKALAVMAASVFNVSEVTIALAYLRADGSWDSDATTLGAWTLMGLVDQLSAYSKQAQTAAGLYESGWDPPTNPSEAACRYCECECQSRYGATEAA